MQTYCEIKINFFQFGFPFSSRMSNFFHSIHFKLENTVQATSNRNSFKWTSFSIESKGKIYTRNWFAHELYRFMYIKCKFCAWVDWRLVNWYGEWLTSNTYYTGCPHFALRTALNKLPHNKYAFVSHLFEQVNILMLIADVILLWTWRWADILRFLSFAIRLYIYWLTHTAHFHIHDNIVFKVEFCNCNFASGH